MQGSVNKSGVGFVRLFYLTTNIYNSCIAFGNINYIFKKLKVIGNEEKSKDDFYTLY